MSISKSALLLVHQARLLHPGDVREPYVALLTAAATAGHFMEQTREQMHETLDKVFLVAQVIALEVTETKQ